MNEDLMPARAGGTVADVSPPVCVLLLVTKHRYIACVVACTQLRFILRAYTGSKLFLWFCPLHSYSALEQELLPFIEEESQKLAPKLDAYEVRGDLINGMQDTMSSVCCLRWFDLQTPAAAVVHPDRERKDFVSITTHKCRCQ